MGSKKSEKRSEKHKKKKKHRSRSSSSESSSSSGSSAEERKIRKKLKKKLKKLKRLKKKEKAEKKIKKISEAKEVALTEKKKEKKELLPPPGTSYDVNVSLMEKSRALAPMTKEEWEKQQNVLKRVYDEETGRTRLVKGNGEIMEECVSRERHLAINRQATRGDGEYFQKVLGIQKN